METTQKPSPIKSLLLLSGILLAFLVMMEPNTNLLEELISVFTKGK